MAIKVAVLLLFIFVTVSPGMKFATGTSAAMSMKKEETADQGQAAQDTSTIAEHIEEKYTQVFALEEISARMKFKMKEFTVPGAAHNARSQGSAKLVAASIAGLNVSQLVNETTAVSIAYTMLKGQEIIFMMDMGFGHFLLCTLTVYNGIAEKKPRGTEWIGNHLAYRLNDYFITLLKRTYKKDIRKSKKLVRKLLAKCVKAQKMLRTHPRLQLDLSSIVFDLLFVDGSPLNFGVDQNGILAEIISINTRLPTMKTVFVEFDKWNPDDRTIQVYAGARPFIKDCIAIGMIHLSLTAEAASWEPPKALVTMRVDANGILHVEVNAIDTMESASIMIDIRTQFSFARIEMMVKESVEFAEADKESMGKAAARNEFQLYLSNKFWQLFQQDKYIVELNVADHIMAFTLVTASRRWIINNENAEPAEVEAKMKAVKKKLDSLKVQYTPKRPIKDYYAAEPYHPFEIDAQVNVVKKRLGPFNVQYTPEASDLSDEEL